MTRRRFLAVTGATGAALAVPTFIPASALGRDGRPPPSGRITVGIVGWGMIAPDNSRADGIKRLPGCRVVQHRREAPKRSFVDTINAKGITRIKTARCFTIIER